MLQNLSKQVSDCMQRAEECAYRAKIEGDPGLARDYLEMERRWLSLARSYQFSEQLQSFSNHNKKRQDEANGILDRMGWG